MKLSYQQAINYAMKFRKSEKEIKILKDAYRMNDGKLNFIRENELNLVSENDNSITELDWDDHNYPICLQGMEQIGDAGIKLLVNAMNGNTNVISINLNNNNISSKGIQELSEMLKENTTLEKLSLSNNNIDDTGARYLSEALQVNKTLKYIDLGINNISDIGAIYLSEALQNNTGLTDFYVDDNPYISKNGEQAIVDAIVNNTNLGLIRLYGVELKDYKEITGIDESIVENSDILTYLRPNLDAKLFIKPDNN